MIALLLITVLSRKPPSQPVITYVTALYDIGRGNIDKFKRSFDVYLNFFQDLLHTRNNLIVYGDKSLKKFVYAHRPYSNTVFVEQTVEDILNKWWLGRPVQKLRAKIMEKSYKS